MTQKPLTIIMTGGGTGGHTRPLLSLGRELKKRSEDVRLIYIGFTGEKFMDSLAGNTFDSRYAIYAGKLRRYPITPKTLFLNIRDIFLVIIGLFQALLVIRKIRPDVVFSKGGFVAVPVNLAARLYGVPIVTHDSDSLPGLANRAAGYGAAIHAVGMPPDLYRYPSAKIRHVGVPIDETYHQKIDREKARNYLRENNYPSRGFILLVMSGSLGAKSINTNLPKIAKSLLGKHKDLSIIHITGKKNGEGTQDIYRSHLSAGEMERIKIVDYSNHLYELTAAADLVITRAGASTLAELSALKKPCVIVPSPHLASGHQLHNARLYESAAAAVILDNDAPSRKWLSTIDELISNPRKLKELSGKIGQLAKPNAASDLAGLILSTASEPKE